MIEKKTLTAIEFDKLDTAAVLLKVYENSPLAEVCDTLSVAALVHKDTSEMPQLTEVEEYINAQACHTDCVNDVKVLGVRAVRSLGDLVKNTIFPHIRSVVESVGRHLNDDSQTSYWTVVPKTLPPILDTMVLLRMVSSIRGSARITDSTLNNGIGEFDDDYIRSLMKVSDEGGFNALLEGVLSKENSEAMWFVKQLLSGRAAVKPETSPETLVIAFIVLLATKTPPASATVSLEKWELNRAVLINSVGHAILSHIDAYERQVRQGLLYCTPKLDHEGIIFVNDKVYRVMLDKGLTPEVVIGNELLGRKYMSFQLLSESAAKECASAYNLDRRAKTAAKAQESRTYRIRAIQDALRNDLNKIAERESWPVDGDSRDKAWGRLKTITEKVLSGPHRDSSTDDLVAAILLGTWYAHTDAWRLIDIASRLGKEDPELKPDEIFALAKIEYVAKWIASQIYIVGDVNDDDKDSAVEVPYVTASVS